MSRKEAPEDPSGKPESRRGRSGLAVGTVVLRDRRLRRNLLFGLTLLTLLLVSGGAIFLGDVPREHPMAFLLFWGLCFLLAGFLLLLAFYDLLAVRKEHRNRVRALEREIVDEGEEKRRSESDRES